MNIILPELSIFSQLVREQPNREGVKYRLLYYCIYEEVGEGYLLYNLLTKSLVLLDREEFARKEDLPELRSHWFAVPEGYDEHKLALQIRALARLRQKNSDQRSYTILTTTDCNARCFYCFEKGKAQKKMSEETAKKVARFIVQGNNLPTALQNGTEKVKIQWFGGEPLYNAQAIDTICSGMRDHGIPYVSSMVSNGYLFDQSLVEKAKSLWNLQKIQITLDGTRDTYNRCKNYIYPNIDAYDRVISNINSLLDGGINVNIRLNIDLHNADDLLLLADELAERFGGRNNLAVYSHALFDNLLSPKSETHRQILLQKQITLQDRLKQHDLVARTRLSRQVKINRCMVDSGKGVLIAPDGSLGLCEHYVDSDFFGHIDSADRNEQIYSSFMEECEEEPQCPKCPYFPNCIRLKKCDSAVCHSTLVTWQLNELKHAMRCEYERYLRTK